MNEETGYDTIEPKVFTFDGKTYKYDFNTLTVEQAELAREAGEFKLHQLQAEPESFRQVIRSRGAEWLAIILSYLLRETKDGIMQPFNKDKAETDVENWIKRLPVKYLEDLRSCVKDFFTGIGRQQTGSALLQGEKKRNGIEMLLPILQKTMLGNLSKSDS
jgi:hypothetical protein